MTSDAHESDITDPRVVRSRTRIIAAATEVLVDVGPRGVTVDAIAERSGVAKSTLYRHWPSLNDLLIEVFQANVPEVRPTASGVGCEDALRGVMRQVAKSFAVPEWVRIVPSLIALRQEFPEVAELMQADRFERMGPIADLLQRGVSEGVLPGELDPSRVTQLLVGPLFFALIMGDVHDLDRLADAVVDQFFAAFGLRPRP